jgi:hypothetical protein
LTVTTPSFLKRDNKRKRVKIKKAASNNIKVAANDFNYSFETKMFWKFNKKFSRGTYCLF